MYAKLSSPTRMRTLMHVNVILYTMSGIFRLPVFPLCNGPSCNRIDAIRRIIPKVTLLVMCTRHARGCYIPTPDVSVNAVVRSIVSCLASVDLSFWSVSTKFEMAHKVDIISKAILKSSWFTGIGNITRNSPQRCLISSKSGVANKKLGKMSTTMVSARVSHTLWYWS